MVNRTTGQFGTPGGMPLWGHPLQQQQQQPPQHISPQNANPVRQPFVASDRSLGTSDRSNSAQEVEELLGSQGRLQRKAHFQGGGGWASTSQAQQQQRGKPILPLYPSRPERSRNYAQYLLRHLNEGHLGCLGLGEWANKSHTFERSLYFRTTIRFIEQQVKIMSTDILLVVGVLRYSWRLSESNDTNTENANIISVLEVPTKKSCETSNEDAKNEASGMHEKEQARGEWAKVEMEEAAGHEKTIIQ
jgi:hypothetical protein